MTPQTPLSLESVHRALAATPLRHVDTALVLALCRDLLHGGAVPLPGGHGGHGGTHHDACTRSREWPGTGQRAYVALGLLAGLFDADGQHVERWHAKEWLACAEAWFERFDAEFTTATAPRERWPALLGALLALVLAQWGATGRLADRAHELGREAQQRLYKLVASRQGMARQPLQPPGGWDIGAGGDAAQWQLANAALAQTEPAIAAELAHALYFMHVLHATLVIRQPALERGNTRARAAFYGHLHTLLRTAEGSCKLCCAARRVLGALPRLAVFEHSAAAGVQALAERLPPCFSAYRQGPAPRWEFVALHIDAADICSGLQQTHRLAEAVADMLIDPLRAAVGPPHAGFTTLAYAYLAGAMGTTQHQGLGHPVGPQGAPREAVLRLFKRLAEGDLQQQAGALLRELPATPAQASACALCLSGSGAR